MASPSGSCACIRTKAEDLCAGSCCSCLVEVSVRMVGNEMTASPGGQGDNRRRSNSTLGTKKAVSRFRRMLVAPAGLFLIWAPLTILLVWAVVTGSLVAYFAESRPEIALQLRSTNATALVNRAAE